MAGSNLNFAATYPMGAVLPNVGVDSPCVQACFSKHLPVSRGCLRISCPGTHDHGSGHGHSLLLYKYGSIIPMTTSSLSRGCCWYHRKWLYTPPAFHSWMSSFLLRAPVCVKRNKENHHFGGPLQKHRPNWTNLSSHPPPGEVPWVAFQSPGGDRLRFSHGEVSRFTDQQGSLDYTPEHCLVNGGVPLFWC